MRHAIPLLTAVSAAILAAASASAQTDCATPNCVFGDAPPLCKNRAAPRIPTVTMSGSLVFVPAEPRIEPGACLQWRSAAGPAHSSSAATCPDDATCGAPPPLGCTFETGNVGGSEFATCHYSAEEFPAGTGDNYYCRIHATATAGTMRGVLRVTTPIVLSVNKNVGAGSVDLSWTGGGVAGDVSYKVARQSGGDPRFPLATTTTVNPAGGVLGTTFVDAGELSSPTTRYYLVRNKQTNEP